MAKQYGSYVDTAECTGCNTCRIACKDFYDLELELTIAGFMNMKAAAGLKRQ